MTEQPIRTVPLQVGCALAAAVALIAMLGAVRSCTVAGPIEAEQPVAVAGRKPIVVDDALKRDIVRELETETDKLAPQRTPEQQAVVRDVARLLTAAAESDAYIVETQVGREYRLAVGESQFCRAKDASAEAARWREIVEAMRATGLIEQARSLAWGPAVVRTEQICWRLTLAGFNLVKKAP